MTDHAVPSANAHAAIAAERFRRSRGLWRILALLAATVAVLALVGRFVLPGQALVDHIARVEINGLITTDAERVAAFKALAEDKRVKAVIVAINSTGGSTAGGEELYESLTRLRETKPVVATINEFGASAAYMTAIATDHVFARRLSIVGSIGVLYQHINAGKLLDTIGVDLDKVASGPLKAEPDWDEPMVGPARDSLAALVDDSFQWFVDVVAERRGLERAAVLSLADGRIVTGRVGVENRLIDAIGGEAEAIAWLETERDLPADLAVVKAWPRPDTGFDLLGAVLGGQARSLLGLPASAPIPLDGLVSLWQVEPTS